MPEPHKTTCKDGGMHNPLEVPCPCECGGTLRADGRNKADNLTFLVCTTCGCTHLANDLKKE